MVAPVAWTRGVRESTNSSPTRPKPTGSLRPRAKETSTSEHGSADARGTAQISPTTLAADSTNTVRTTKLLRTTPTLVPR
ncbi:Uncharacterised protein [Mycobacteroides abscessus subsp. abscessus]|nr:Uncharacterised protein [Mycobacteroides abscessus subsp. abscessus]